MSPTPVKYSTMKISLKSIGKSSIRLGVLGIIGAPTSRRYSSALLSYHLPLFRNARHVARYPPRRCLARLHCNPTDNEHTETSLMRSDAIAQTEQLVDFYKHNSFGSNPRIWMNSDSDSAAAFVRNEIDTVLFDCDGVLYRTQDPCPRARDCIQTLLDLNKTVLFVTNNAGVNRRELRDKLAKILDIDSLTIDQMVSSSYSASQFLKHELGSCGNDGIVPGIPPRIHVIGSQGLCEELESCGFDISGGPAPAASSEMTREQLADYNFPESPIDALVVGHDTAMDFRKLTIADNLLLRNPDAMFVATNRDNFDMVGADGRHIPGNGCTVVALEYSSRRVAQNVGKPSPILFELIRKDHPHAMSDPSRCLFVGDRLDTDIRFGNDNGMRSLLVMTGVTTADSMVRVGCGTEEEPLPDFIAPFVGVLV